jgi:nitroimidazol reductase NimA-like FMN-containing flavoprotein (pyridoxamine 5'-phosphate oxidase superfamily)
LSSSSRLRQVLKDLFSSQRFAVLATQNSVQPYGNLVAFAATNDLKYILFATVRGTRKYANIAGNPRVAMVMDNRTNQEADLQKAIAVTATGIVEEVKEREKNRLLEVYLSRHPNLKKFVTAPECALLKLKVDTYFVVSTFQKVEKLFIKK